jgi:hypothetical protein
MRHGESVVLRPQQISHDVEPFRIQCVSANRLACPAIPILCVAPIAFLAMPVSVDPRTFSPFILMGGFVRPRPIALGIPPQSGERVCESGWRPVAASDWWKSSKVILSHRCGAEPIEALVLGLVFSVTMQGDAGQEFPWALALMSNTGGISPGLEPQPAPQGPQTKILNCGLKTDLMSRFDNRP